MAKYDLHVDVPDEGEGVFTTRTPSHVVVQGVVVGGIAAALGRVVQVYIPPSVVEMLARNEASRLPDIEQEE